MKLAPRPRVLYVAFFVWFATLGGGFVAPFLQQEASLSDGYVGTVLSLQWFAMALTGSVGGTFADYVEGIYPGKGRPLVMQLGVVLGTLGYLGHGIHHIFDALPFVQTVPFHLSMRLLFAAANALTAPVLDGLTIAYLEQQEKLHGGMGKADFGKERLYGAISWAVGNVVAGVLIDWFGFASLYGLATVSGVCAFLLLHVFAVAMASEPIPPSRVDISKDNVPHETTSLLQKDNVPKTLEEGSIQEGDKEDELSSLQILIAILSSCYGIGFVVSFLTLNMGTSIVEGLIFTWFQELGANNTFCGLTVALTVVFEVPLFHFSPTLLKAYGPGVLQAVAAFAYVTRVIGYSIIPEGRVFYVLLLEPLHGITYALSMTSAVDFMAQRLPASQAAAGQGWVWTGRSFGAVAGLLGGGWTQELYGGRIMYRIFAGVVAFGMFVYAIAYRTKHSARSANNEEDELSQQRPTRP